jgi:hypothetical protein
MTAILNFTDYLKNSFIDFKRKIIVFNIARIDFHKELFHN